MTIKIPSNKYSYRKFYSLDVTFKMTKDYLKTDKEITKLVGTKPTGSGVLLKAASRDLSFRFDKETEAETAQKVLKKAGFVSRIKTYETDTP